LKLWKYLEEEEYPEVESEEGGDLKCVKNPCGCGRML